MGPVEDFLPVGYTEAKPGETFLKIGIGMLVRPDTASYSIVPPYKIKNSGAWSTTTKQNKIEFVQTLNDSLYSYQYKKTVELAKDKPGLILSHTLKNTGTRPIETLVYDHNFLMPDKQTTGPGFVITFPFKPVATGSNEELATITNNEIIFRKQLNKNDHVYYQEIKGYGANINDYDIKVEDKNTGIGVRITSDQPLSKLAFWSASTTVCPEPFIKIDVNPGASFSWKIFYNFFASKP
jgi:hypothetical protein